MKNNASNPSETQALQVQAVQLLPALTATLMTLDYHEISHQRLSQQVSHQYLHTEIILYQGLIRAQYSQFGEVMIKWELSPDVTHGLSNYESSSHILSNHELSSLSHETAVLYILNKSAQIEVQAQNNSASLLSIAPPVLAYDTLQTNILNQNQRLTILVMPYYLQGSLAHQLNDKKKQLLTNEQKQQLIIQAAHLIVTLHNRGWLHNDIKPSNILLEDYFSLNNLLENDADNKSIAPKWLLTDFALAEYFGKELNNSCEQSFTSNSAGTPAYLAPERWQGQGATQQSDIYAFGVMMYEILTGKRPFNISKQSNEPPKDWAIEHCQKPIPILSTSYQQYQAVINKALAKRVGKRYQSMEDVLGDLKAVKE
jgi:serine/threonine-protein kinase